MSTVSMAPGDVPEAVPTGREQRRCTLAWNEAGDRLICVGNHTGVTMWTIGEDRSTFQVCTVPTGAAMAKVNCGIFVSPATVIATAGRKTEIEMGVNPHGISAFGSLKTWPYTSAGLCVWDTLAPPQSSLVMHDGNTDMPPVVPSHYSCLTWAADRQQIICGTKTGELRIFDIRQRKVCQRLVAHEDSVMYSFVLGGTGRFATLSAKAELKVWSLSDFTCIETLPKLHRTSGVSSVIGKSQVLNCAAMISERHLVTGGCDGTLLLTRL